jgi:hypothetical protein
LVLLSEIGPDVVNGSPLLGASETQLQQQHRLGEAAITSSQKWSASPTGG